MSNQSWTFSALLLRSVWPASFSLGAVTAAAVVIPVVSALLSQTAVHLFKTRLFLLHSGTAGPVPAVWPAFLRFLPAFPAGESRLNGGS